LFGPLWQPGIPGEVCWVLTPWWLRVPCGRAGRWPLRPVPRAGGQGCLVLGAGFPCKLPGLVVSREARAWYPVLTGLSPHPLLPKEPLPDAGGQQRFLSAAGSPVGALSEAAQDRLPPPVLFKSQVGCGDGGEASELRRGWCCLQEPARCRTTRPPALAAVRGAPPSPGHVSFQQSCSREDEPVRVLRPGHAAGGPAHVSDDGHEGLPGGRRAAALLPHPLHLHRGEAAARRRGPRFGCTGHPLTLLRGWAGLLRSLSRCSREARKPRKGCVRLSTTRSPSTVQPRESLTRSVAGEALGLLSRLRLLHVLGSRRSVVCAPWLKRFCSLLLFLLESGRGRLQADVSKSGASSTRNELCCLPQTLGFNERFYGFRHSVLRRSQLDVAESTFGTGSQASAPDRSQLGPSSPSVPGPWTELLFPSHCQDAGELSQPGAGCSLLSEMVAGWRPLPTSTQRSLGCREGCWDWREGG